MNELNHGSGKGDKERSPGWRKNFDEIAFPPSEGFVRRGNRLVKCYTPGRKAVFNFPEKPAVLEPLKCGGKCAHPGEKDCACISDYTRDGSGGWVCTLPKGHIGAHIACCARGGTTAHSHGVFVWSRLPDEPTHEEKLAAFAAAHSEIKL